MTWEEIMRRVLPPAGGLSPHITSEFGATNRPRGSTNPHRAVDFNYGVGPNGQTGINLTHPTLHSPVAGVVTRTGGKYGIIAIRDANGLSHEILHSHTQDVKVGDLVGVGTPIGTMGSTGANSEHVHYQLKDRAGNVINPTEFWNNLDPGKSDPGEPAFLDQSKRAAEIISGLTEKSSRNGGAAPDRLGSPFFNPFNPAAAAAFVPRPNAPAASDDSANFVDRFGNWDAKPFGAFDNSGAPRATPPKPGQRSDIPDDVTPVAATNDAAAPVRILARVNPPSTQASPDALPLPPAAAQPLLGIVSGLPMRDYPVPPPVFQTRDQASPLDDDELFQRWMRYVDG